MYCRIRELRKDKGLTQEKVARILRCTQASYSNYECGVTDIPTDILIRLARFHNVTVDYLLGRGDTWN